MADTSNPRGPKPISQDEINKAMAGGTTEPKVETVVVEPKVEVKTETKVEPKVETKETKTEVKDEAKVETEKKKPVEEDLLADEDELVPDERGMIKGMSLKSFMARLKRQTRGALREAFGTDDLPKIKKDLEELATLRTEKAEAAKAKLTETDRLKVERDEAVKKAEEAEARAERRETRAVYREVESDMKAFVSDLVDKDDVDDFLNKCARAVDDDKLNITKTSHLKRWATKYVAEHPKWKKSDATTTTKDETKVETKVEPKTETKVEETKPRKVLVTNGGGGVRPAPAGGGEVVNMAKMSKEEVFKKTGLRL